MVNKCVVTNCKTGYSNGPKKSTFHFPEESDLRKRWIYFVNRKDWVPSKYSAICVNHFDDKFINYGKRCTLKWNLLPVPTIQTDEISGSSTLRVPKLPRKKPTLRYLGKDEFEDFQSVDKIINLDSLTEQHSPPGFTFKKMHDSVVYYKLCFDEKSGIPIVFESITVNKDLYVSLSYKGYHISLPEWFRSGHNCKLTSCSMLENFPVYIRNKANDMNSILTELNEIRYYSPQGRPPYSASIIRYALILRHTSAQSYKLLLEQLPLPSFSLLRKIQSGDINAYKAITVLLQKDCVSIDCVLLVDEMYLQKAAQYQSGKYIGEDSESNLYKGVVVFMIVGLQKAIPYVVRSSPEVCTTGPWLKKEIDECITSLHQSGFKVRAIVTDNHSTNVNAFSELHKSYTGDGKLFIYHPAYNGVLKTYLLYDIIHLIKNVRNNLLNGKKFVFPSFSFDFFRDKVEVPAGFITWDLFHKVYEKDQLLNGNLKKARKINYQVTHPGNNKQDVNLALAILDETTTAAILSYFPERNDAAQFLSLFHKLFITLNSKQMFNTSNQLGNAAVKGDKKPTFYREIANWIEIWSTCEYFTLTKQTSHALITTLRATASLIDDLLEESYTFVLTSRLQSDPLELRFSKYRQMSGGRFLVSLLEVCNSEKILAVRSLLKEDINFWDENIYQTFEYSTLENIMQDIALLSSEILECQLSEDSMEVAVTIAGYIAKKLKKRFKCLSCGQKMVSTDQDVLNSEYLKILSRGGLICPSQSLSDFICHLFSILDIISPILIKHCSYSLSIKSFAEQIFKIYYSSVDFTCEKHQEWGIKYGSRIVINIFYNNLQKETTDSVRKDQVKEFKKRQRTDS